jgi:hypothetical protein
LNVPSYSTSAMGKPMFVCLFALIRSLNME